MNTQMYYSVLTISSSCSGRSMTNIAPFSSSSLRGRNPHVTATDRSPLLAAVRISTLLSPTYRVSADVEPVSVRMFRTIVGSGLGGISSRWRARRRRCLQENSGRSIFPWPSDTCSRRQPCGAPALQVVDQLGNARIRFGIVHIVHGIIVDEILPYPEDCLFIALVLG